MRLALLLKARIARGGGCQQKLHARTHHLGEGLLLVPVDIPSVGSKADQHGRRQSSGGGRHGCARVAEALGWCASGLAAGEMVYKGVCECPRRAKPPYLWLTEGGLHAVLRVLASASPEICCRDPSHQAP